MQQRTPITVFLADDHPLLRTGLRLSLDPVPDIELIGEAEDGFTAVEKIKARQPDVSLIDVDMPGLSGIDAIRLLRKSCPDMKLLVLSTYHDDHYIQAAMDAGADGYVLKCVAIEELVEIIKSFCSGEPKLSPYLVNLTRDINTAGKSAEYCQIDALSIREKQVLDCIADGKGNKEIAGMLYISTETVKSHVKNIFKKLKVKNRIEAVRTARKNKLVV